MNAIPLMANLSAPDAAHELLRRRRVRLSLAEWARYKGYEPAAHHRLIISEIESFLIGDDEVLLLFAPPGSAKSTYVSVLLPSWYLANHPMHSILAATHNVEFAERWGRRVRNDIASDPTVLGIELAEDSKAAARWALTVGGEYYGVGAGTGISGFRANLGVCDDLFGSREDAYSKTVREKRWNWYVDDFSARLKPGAKRILMNTRWHEEDVAGLAATRMADNGATEAQLMAVFGWTDHQMAAHYTRTANRRRLAWDSIARSYSSTSMDVHGRGRPLG